ncbi:MAG: hypothetical protein AAGF98_06825 [Cyanobacteria bacterium P01_H01_bin.153]
MMTAHNIDWRFWIFSSGFETVKLTMLSRRIFVALEKSSDISYLIDWPSDRAGAATASSAAIGSHSKSSLSR